MNFIWKWLTGLFKKKPQAGGRHAGWPTTEQIAAMPWFDGLGPENIVVVSTKEGALRAYDELAAVKVVGFDTESKPTFKKGEKSTGPHVIQFSTLEQAYIFMIHDSHCRKTASALIALPTLKKVGFGLQDDVKRIREKLKVHPHDVVDVETIFAAQGYGRGVGVKVAVALLFKRRFKKSSKASTSNWAARDLSDSQLLYAANDAYAAIRAYDFLVNGAR